MVEYDLFEKTVLCLVYLGQGGDFKLTTELSEKSRQSAISPQQGNQKRLKWKLN